MMMDSDYSGDESFDDDDDDDYNKTVEYDPCEFESLCYKLRENDPKVKRFNVTGYSDERTLYSQELGKALKKNTHLQVLSLDLPFLRYENVHKIFLREIGILPSLHTVNLSVSPDYLDMGYPYQERKNATLKLFTAINGSKSIKNLNINGKLGVAYSDMEYLLKETTTLKSLNMRIDHGGWQGVTEKWIAAAFGANTTLENLYVHQNSDPTTVALVLRELHSHPTLENINLLCGSKTSSSDAVGAVLTHMEAVSCVLGGSAPLHTLHFYGYTIDEKSMQTLVNGLKAAKSLVKLSFLECTWDNGACNVFVRYMRTKSTPESIQELCLQDFKMFVHGDKLMESILVPPSDELTVGTSDRSATIGSSLYSLQYDNASDIWKVMNSHASTVRLCCLKMLVDPKLEATIAALPNLVHVRDLEIDRAQQHWKCQYDTVRVLHALRQNGSLHHVFIGLGWLNASIFGRQDDEEVKLVQAYCRRNRILPELMTNMCKSNVDGGTVKKAKSVLSLLPTLCKVAQQSQRMSPNNIMIGLLAVLDGVGPCRLDKKRKNAV